MTVFEKMIEVYGYDVPSLLEGADQEEYQKVLADFEECDESGMIDYESDSDEEQSIFQSAFGGPVFPKVPIKAAARQMIIRMQVALEKAYLSKIPRNAMLSTLNILAMNPNGTSRMEVAPGLSRSAFDLQRAWNDANPKEKPIFVNGEMYFSN